MDAKVNQVTPVFPINLTLNTVVVVVVVVVGDKYSCSYGTGLPTPGDGSRVAGGEGGRCSCRLG
jgi:hypothetical protein